MKTLLPTLNLTWGPAEHVGTPEGLRIIRHAEPTNEFWKLWSKSKSNCKDAGLTVSKNESGEWLVCLTTTADTTPAAPLVSAASGAEQAAASLGEMSAGTLSTPKSNIDLNILLEMIHAFILRFVVFSRPEQAIVVALWIAHTWVLANFRFTPYLFITSAVRRCGKTRLLESLRCLVREPWSVVGATDATLIRKIDEVRPTLLLDEADTIYGSSKAKGREGLRGILNCGFSVGATVPRCGSGREVVEFSVFCAKALAGIGNCLPDTVLDRCIKVNLARRSREQHAERFHLSALEAELAVLVDNLAAWATAPDTASDLAAACPQIPDELGDRAADIVLPLLAIAEMAKGEWAGAARQALVDILRHSDEEESDPRVKLLSRIREVFVKAKKLQLSTRFILQSLASCDDDEPWTNEWARALRSGNTRGPAAKMAKLLRPFEVHAGTIRLPGSRTLKGYKFEDFTDAFARYLPPLPQNDATTPQPNN